MGKQEKSEHISIKQMFSGESNKCFGLFSYDSLTQKYETVAYVMLFFYFGIYLWLEQTHFFFFALSR